MTWPAVGNYAVAAFANIWLSMVNSVVPDPYLDEVFHVPQAQAYCRGQWRAWDPKITTPPGLYILASALRKLIPSIFLGIQCTTSNLRWMNFLAAVVLIPSTAEPLYRELHPLSLPDELKETERHSWQGRLMGRLKPSFRNHTVCNLSLFPPLFFFCALFYTEPWSVFSVLLCHPAHRTGGKRGDLALKNFFVFVQGIIALLFRQTNIFWVAIFYGGLDVVKALEESRPGKEIYENNSLQAIVGRSWHSCLIYNPPVYEAWIEDYFKVVISLVVVAVRCPRVVLMTLAPYLALLGAFGAFVGWNGGVVLGDKSNHVAALHLSQMFYIWPYFVFFSFPVLIGQVTNGVLTQGWPSFSTRTRSKVLPRLSVVCGLTAVMLSVVHYNTVVHPFILADNRHYVFYIFRWVLLRHPYAKYIAVPIYLICGWTVINALGGTPNTSHIGKTRSASAIIVDNDGSVVERLNKASFVMIWLAATSLSLITAPLVEPRYFILPWIMWRLHLPEPNSNSSIQGDNKPAKARSWSSHARTTLKRILCCGYDKLLWLETGWLLFVNIVTMYIFLYRGFSWPQEPGKVQRFMW